MYRRERQADFCQIWTVLQSQIFAIFQATYLLLLGRNYTHSKIFIVTDIEVTLSALASCKITSALIDECLRTQERFGSQNKIIWTPLRRKPECRWVNKKRQTEFVGLEPACEIAQLVKQETKKMATKSHLTHWRDTRRPKQFRTFLEESCTKAYRICLSSTEVSWSSS